MKRGAPDDPKMYRLARHLGVPRLLAVGIMESLWQWAANYAPTGLLTPENFPVMFERVGGFELGISAERALEALKQSEWITDCGNGESVIHNWFKHCEDSVHVKLARHGLYFASGERPKLHRLSKDERERIDRQYQEADKRRAHGERTKSAQPMPMPLPLPMPTPSAAPEAFSTNPQPPVHVEKPGEGEKDQNQTPKTKTPVRVDERFYRNWIRRDDFAFKKPDSDRPPDANDWLITEAMARDPNQTDEVRELAVQLLALNRDVRKPPGVESPPGVKAEVCGG